MTFEVSRPVIEQYLRDGVIDPSQSLPSSDCQWCEHYKYDTYNSPVFRHLCDGEPMERNIYTTPCPHPEKKNVILKGRIPGYQARLDIIT